jgi:hypothetical protein
VQNALAAWVTSRRFVPLRPGANEPNVDLAWTTPDGQLFVAEVKSLLPTNERAQLRRALGQVLEYRHRLRRPGTNAIAVVALPQPPLDELWRSILEEVDVRMACYPDFADLDGAANA